MCYNGRVTGKTVTSSPFLAREGRGVKGRRAQRSSLTGGREMRPERVVVRMGGTYDERSDSCTTGGEAGRAAAGGTAGRGDAIRADDDGAEDGASDGT